MLTESRPAMSVPLAAWFALWHARGNLRRVAIYYAYFRTPVDQL